MSWSEKFGKEAVGAADDLNIVCLNAQSLRFEARLLRKEVVWLAVKNGATRVGIQRTRLRDKAAAARFRNVA